MGGHESVGRHFHGRVENEDCGGYTDVQATNVKGSH